MALAFFMESCIRIIDAYYLIRFGTAAPRFLVGSPFGFIFSWLIGALVAQGCTTNKMVKLNKWHIIATVSLGVGIAFFKPLCTFSFMLFSVASAMAIMYAHKNASQIKWWRMGGLVTLGVVSYSFYPIHQPVIMLVPRIYHRLNIWPPPLIVYATCVFMVVPLFWCSRIMRKVVELPSINLGYQLLAMRAELRRQSQILPS
jgi:peptidoglycan/LPS O-acetylase OafA/YrhL